MHEQGESLGARVRSLRKARSLTEEAFSREARVSRSQLELVETGKTRWLRPDTLRRYAQVLGVSERYLQHGEDDEPPVSGPPLEVYLRQNERLSEENVATVQRIVQALKREQLAELEGNGETVGL